MRAGGLSRRRNNPLSFTSLTNWARPTTLGGATRQVPFTDKTSLTNAITNMQAGDYIYYNGTGVLTISSSTTYPFSITSKNPASTVTIDFGTPSTTQIDAWSPGASSGNYVKFDYSGSSSFQSFKLAACSNITLYGGMSTASGSTPGGGGVGIWGTSSNILWYDHYVNSIGGSGVSILNNTTGGAAGPISNVTVRAEVNQWAMNPSLDPHIDKGAGLQACILHGGNVSSSYDKVTCAIYGHDPLQPGATSGGKTWPEGGGGSVIEPGNDQGTQTNFTLYVKAVNCLMQPNGTNPGSAVNGETGGNGINIWGSTSLAGMVVGWVEATNCSGGPVHCTSSSGWQTGTPHVTVNHGRHTNTNQYVNTSVSSNRSVPYDTTGNVVYNDCT